MGILDDAIREHLDLKRRAGADPSEISRLEREAFGAGETPADAPPAPEAEADVAEPEAAVAVEPYEPEPVLPPPPAEPEPEPEPVAESVPPPPPPEEELDQPTRAFTAQEVEDAEQRAPAPEPVPESPAPPEGEHDELEDTPDFLQETPEHDRLWFEQKPPKDFDF